MMNMKLKLKRIFNNRIQLQWAIAIFGLCMIVPAVTHAGGSELFVEDTLTKIQSTLEGPVAYFIGVGSIVLAAAGWAASESGSTARQGFKMAAALAIMFNAASLVKKLWSNSGGLGM
jgi:type IV secretory pathway VirB2 component (pilin)